MGFYTNITISNDFWHQIAKDPEALVEYIGWAMSEGTNSPIGEAFSENRDDDNSRSLRRRAVRYSGPQGVVVHRAQHADTPQVIANTYGGQAIAAHEIPIAIQHGWLKGGPHRAEQAEKIAKRLHALASDIRKELRRQGEE